MFMTNPSQRERHYFCLLLHHIPGARSFTDLKTLPNGTVHNSFKETALALGPLQNDDEWDECMAEASISFMPKQLCSLFVTILIFGEPANYVMLWTIMLWEK